ncbi:MAG: CBS domain-containing protein, partial [Acidimicrobiia bacterium]|nr:CBS domain-containing protein [Acidimicrobiia bacterium]
MNFRLRTPRAYAERLRTRARSEPREVAQYLDDHPEEWEALAMADPADAADILEELGDEAASTLIKDLDPEDAAEVLDELRTDLAVEIIEDLSPDEAATLLVAMAPMEAADVIGGLADHIKQAILDVMEPKSAEEIQRLLSYPSDSAGGLMTTDVAALPVGLTAGEAIEAIRRLHETLEDLSYVYIVDDQHRLVGVLSFRELVFNRPGVGLAEAMIADPVSVTPYTDREQVAELTQRYGLFGLPVVEPSGRLLGMVT